MDFGPEPIPTSNCPYMGTDYCHLYCDRWETIPKRDCNLDCQYCAYAKLCPCHAKALPWEITFDHIRYLVINPHRSVYLVSREYLRVYGEHPDIFYRDDLGLFVAPIFVPPLNCRPNSIST